MSTATTNHEQRTTNGPTLQINLDRYHDHCTRIYTLVTTEELQAGQDVTITDSSGGTFCKQGEVVSILPLDLATGELPSIIAWVVAGTNAIAAMRQLRTRFPISEKVTIAVIRVRE